MYTIIHLMYSDINLKYFQSHNHTTYQEVICFANTNINNKTDIKNLPVIPPLCVLINVHRMRILNSCFLLQNSQRRPLVTTSDSTPTISASTTATNLSSLDVPNFNSLIIHNRAMGSKEQNLLVAQPEIEPLHTKTEKDLAKNTPANDSTIVYPVDNVYVDTVQKKPVSIFRLFNQVNTVLLFYIFFNSSLFSVVH